MSDIVLQVEGISKKFPGVQALKDVSLSLHKGSVHAVCGENGAGKSTLMKILMGVEHPDAGTVSVEGTPVRIETPRQAIDIGISIIEQELSPIPDMTVAENIFLGREARTMRFFVDRRKMIQSATALLKRLHSAMDVTRRMKDLTVAEIQMVEIAKSLSYDFKILIMDEPTSALGDQDSKALFEVVKALQREGKAILYVSHRMNEIFELADTVTVFRDGALISTDPISEVNHDYLVRQMTGRKIEQQYVKENTPGNEEILRVNNISKTGKFHNVSLALRSGEILGLFGLLGSGRSDLCSTIFGFYRPDDGEIRINDKPVVLKSPAHAIEQGIAYITADRKTSGLVLTESVLHNLTLPSIRAASPRLLINKTIEERRAREAITQFNVKTPSLNQTVRLLSGGNQQKVVLGKWILTDPKVLILNEPTRGIDVGAKREIYQLMSDFAKSGYGIIMVSSELPEMLAMSDRIGVMYKGELVHTFEQNEASDSSLMSVASWGTPPVGAASSGPA